MPETTVAPSASEPAPEAPAKRDAGGRGRRIRILLALLVAGALAGVGYWLYARDYESTDDAFIEGHVIYVSPRVAGQVVALNVTDNQHVAAGHLLVEIDPRDYEVRLAQARGALGAARARRRSAEISVPATELRSPPGWMSQASRIPFTRNEFRPPALNIGQNVGRKLFPASGALALTQRSG